MFIYLDCKPKASLEGPPVKLLKLLTTLDQNCSFDWLLDWMGSVEVSSQPSRVVCLPQAQSCKIIFWRCLLKGLEL
jgi:hypothetical protein